MTDVTRTSTEKLSGSVYTASTNGRALVWGKQFTNGLSGGNTVTFSPYGHSNWRRLIQMGQEVTSALTGTQFSASETEFQFLQHDEIFDAMGIDYGVAYIGAKGSPLAYASSVSNASASLNRADNQALGDLAQKVYQAQHALNGQTFIGELGESLHMIRHPAQALFGGIEKYIRGTKKVTSASRTLKQAMRGVSNSWLEYSFGWKPLISDIKSGMEALSEVVTYRQPRKTVVAFGKDFSGASSPTNGSDNYGPVSIKYRVNQESTASVRYRASVQLNVDTGVQKAVQAFGFDWPSFLPTVWELIPYSFVADYFTNIGSIIQAASLPRNACTWIVKNTEFKQDCRCIVDTCAITPSGNPYAKRTTLVVRPGSGSWSKRTVTRSSYGGSIVPGLRLQVPGLSLKWLNLGALAVLHSTASSDLANRFARRG